MNNAIGRNALEFMNTLLTQEEIANNNLRVTLIGELIKTGQGKIFLNLNGRKII